MDYIKFREELLRMMREYADAGMQIDLIERQKLNGQLRYALMMREEGRNCSPVIYLENLYEEFCTGTSMEQTAAKLWLIYREEMKENFSAIYENVSGMKAFEDAAPGLQVRIMHYAKNRKLLQDIPCRRILDLAVCVYYLVEETDGKVRGTIMVRDEHLRDWEIEEDAVFERAIGNTMAAEGMYWNTLEEVLDRKKLLPFPEKLSYSKTGLHILSGKTGVWGAVIAFLPGVADRIYEALGEEFYLLPSSIHEVIIVPLSRAISVPLLEQTVQDVNRLEIPAEEILSDHVYCYNAKDRRLEISG